MDTIIDNWEPADEDLVQLQQFIAEIPGNGGLFGYGDGGNILFNKAKKQFAIISFGNELERLSKVIKVMDRLGYKLDAAET